MATVDSLHTLLVDQLRDIYDAEKRLTKAIPKMARAATSDDLRSALEDHLAETEQQVARLEEAFGELGASAKGKPCAGMKGIIEEGDEHVGEDFDDDGLRDATIIGAAQRVEHYEIAAYGTAIAHARLLDQTQVVRLLEQTLAEEKQADEKLTEIAESVVNLDAASAERSGRAGADRSGRRRASMTQRSEAAASTRSTSRGRRGTSRSRR
jgi:ferritin-like metal-binding protein YciE